MARKQEDIFTRFTSWASRELGRAWIFTVALAALVIWGLSGPLLGFSNTWQLIINTSTTIITFLMVFIIQNTQNRDNLAFNLKLDVIMKKLNADKDDILEAEEKRDKYLEKKIRSMQNGSPKKEAKA